MNQARDRTAGNTLLMRIASNLHIKMVGPVWPFSCNTGIKVTSGGIASPAHVIRPLLWVRFFGRIQKRISDLRSYGFFTTKKKTEDPKKDHLRLLYYICFLPFFFSRKTACQKYFCQIFSQKLLRSWISEIRIWIWSEESHPRRPRGG